MVTGISGLTEIIGLAILIVLGTLREYAMPERDC